MSTVVGHRLADLCRGRKRCALRSSDRAGGPVAAVLDDPPLVVGVLEVARGQARVLEGGEARYPRVRLQCPDAHFGTAVALVVAHEDGRAYDAEEGALRLIGVGDKLAAVFVTQPQGALDALNGGAETGADIPSYAKSGRSIQAAARAARRVRAERLKRLDPRRASGGVYAEPLARGVADRDEDPGLRAAGERPRRHDPHLHGVSHPTVGRRSLEVAR